MTDKIEMPPLPNEGEVQDFAQDNHVDEEPVHKLPNELAQAQAIQREAEAANANDTGDEAQITHYEQPIQDEPLIRRIADKPTPQESFNELKKAKIRAERERDELLEWKRNAEAPKLKQIESDEDLNVSINDNDYVEGKHIQKLVKKVSRLEQQTLEAQQKSYELASEARLKSQYPDIDRVLSSANIDLLRQRHPELAKTLHYNPDFYDKAVATYEMIKAKGISGETELNSANESRIKANMAKPRSLSSLAPQKADSPLTRVNAFAEGLTPDLQKQLQKEMVEAMRNR